MAFNLKLFGVDDFKGHPVLHDAVTEFIDVPST